MLTDYWQLSPVAGRRQGEEETNTQLLEQGRPTALEMFQEPNTDTDDLGCEDSLLWGWPAWEVGDRGATVHTTHLVKTQISNLTFSENYLHRPLGAELYLQMVYTRWGLSGDSRTSCGTEDSQPHETQGLYNHDLTLSLNEVYRRKLEHFEYHIKIMAGKVAQGGTCGQASWPEYPWGQLLKAVLWQAPQNKWVSQVRWLTPLVPALRWRQEDLCEFELSLGYKLNKQNKKQDKTIMYPSLIMIHCFNLYGFIFILRTHLSSSL